MLSIVAFWLVLTFLWLNLRSLLLFCRESFLLQQRAFYDLFREFLSTQFRNNRSKRRLTFVHLWISIASRKSSITLVLYLEWIFTEMIDKLSRWTLFTIGHIHLLLPTTSLGVFLKAPEMTIASFGGQDSNPITWNNTCNWYFNHFCLHKQFNSSDASTFSQQSRHGTN